MNLKKEIEQAFRNRPLPGCVYTLKPVDLSHGIDSDVEDTLWFAGRDWRTLTPEDWEKHNCATTFFEPEAFAYYLPSLMILTMERPSDGMLAADSVIYNLDRSPGRDNWDPPLLRRYLLLSVEELEVLKEWLIELSNYVPYRGIGLASDGPGDQLGRAFDTVAALQEERTLMEQNEISG
jgi:hypothetical protein